MKKILITILIIIALLTFVVVYVFAAGGRLSDYDTIWNAQRAPVDQDITAGLILTQGVFTGTGTGGFYGDVSVAITVDADGVITGVEVVYCNETPSFADPAYAHLIGEVLRVQSADIDIFTNATMTSNAFIEAVANAMRLSAGAGGAAAGTIAESDENEEIEAVTEIIGTVFEGRGTGGFYGDIFVAVVIDDDGNIVHIEVTDHSETPGFANPAFAELIPSVIDAQSYNVDIVAGATYTAEAFLAAVQDALRQAEANDSNNEVEISGTVFEGRGRDGFYGDIFVAVVIDDDGNIVHIEVTDHSETPSFADPAFAQLIPAVIAAQSYNVDIVAGATYTAEAFLAAVRDALRQAGE